MREEITNKKKLDNKGFSLIELIIVIAIMAILIGIVGTQVVPYIEKSKQAKDQQVISSILTNATTAFASNAECYNAASAQKITINNDDIKIDETGAEDVSDEFKTLSGLTKLADVTGKMSSKAGKKISGIVIERNTSGVITVTVNGDADVTKVFKVLSST